MKKPLLFLTALFFFSCLWKLPAQNDQKIFPLSSPVYDALKALYLEQGYAPPSGSKPFSADEIRECLEQISYPALSTAGRCTFRYIEKELDGRVLYGEPDGFAVNGSAEINVESYLHGNRHFPEWEYGYKDRLPMFGITLEMWVLPHFYAIMDLPLQKEPFVVSEDPYNYSNIITDLAVLDAHFPYRGFLSAGGNHWNIQFGRDLQSWGNGGTGNFLLSHTLPYHDVLRFATYWHAFKFSTLYLSLENWDDDDIHEMADVSKGFLGHRMEFRLFNRFTFAISEGMMYGGKYAEFRYFNPFMIYHNYFINDRYGNIAFSAEININPYKWTNIYGQLLLDTLTAAFEKAHYSESIPQANGYLIGAETEIPLGPGYLHASYEWALADPWLYLIEGQPDYIVERRFLSNYSKDLELIRKPLGYPHAPDARVNSFQLAYRVFGAFGVESGVTVIENGTITVDTPYRDDPEAASRTAPSGTAEKKIITRIHGEIKPFFLPSEYLSDIFTLSTDLYFIHVSSYEHIGGSYIRDIQSILSLKVNL